MRRVAPSCLRPALLLGGRFQYVGCRPSVSYWREWGSATPCCRSAAGTGRRHHHLRAIVQALGDHRRGAVVLGDLDRLHARPSDPASRRRRTARMDRAAPPPTAPSARLARMPISRRALTNWPGHSSSSGLANIAFSLIVPVVASIVLSIVSQLALSELGACRRRRTPSPAAWPVAIAAWIDGSDVLRQGEDHRDRVDLRDRHDRRWRRWRGSGCRDRPAASRPGRRSAR